MLLLGTAACSRSCGCIEGETVYEKLDGKVKAELVRDVHWTSGPRTEFSIRVETSPPFDHAIDCDHVDMAEDETGKTIAYRCRGGSGEWSLIRLRGEDRYVVECKAPVGTAKKPDFARMEPLSRGADRVLDCIKPRSDSTEERVWTELGRAIEEDEGAPRAIEVLTRAADRAFERPERDPWWAATFARSSTVRDGVLRDVCAALERDDTKPAPYVRGALHCGLDGPRVGQAAVAQLTARLMAPIPKFPSSAVPGRLAPSDSLALAWAAVIGVDRAPREAGRAACAAAQTLVDSQDDVGSKSTVAPRRVAGAVIAATATRCEAVKPWLAEVPCSSIVDCGDHLCTDKELAPLFLHWREATKTPLTDYTREPRGDGESMAPPEPPRPEVVRLALAYLLGPLDREVTIRNARRHYDVAEPDIATACDDEHVSAGTPCKCGRIFNGDFVCELEAKETRGSVDACGFHIDDAHKRIDDWRRVCVAAGGGCGGYRAAPCCSGLVCEENANVKSSSCKAPATDAAAH